MMDHEKENQGSCSPLEIHYQVYIVGVSRMETSL